jgi:hypothetical protein
MSGFEVGVFGVPEAEARLDLVTPQTEEGLARALTKLGLRLQAKVQENLSGPVLNVRTGVLRSSIDTRVSRAAGEVEASVGTAVKYGRYNEFGVPGPLPPIYAIHAQALRFKIGGRVFFRKKVAHNPLPERSFLRSALAGIAPEIAPAVAVEVAEALAE